MIKKLLRDNELINPIVRNVLRIAMSVVKPLSKLTSLYRVYGNVILEIRGTRFKIWSQADDHIANEIFYSLGYEQGEFLLLEQLIRESRYFIDIGANTGIFSIWAAKANPKLKVFSFEPHPSNFERLVRNISINGQPNIQALPKALGERSGEIELTVPADLGISPTASADEGFARTFYDVAYKNVVVPQTTIDEACSEIAIESFDVIKIDAEYYELAVLKGGRSTLLNKRPLIVIEILQFKNLVSQYPGMQGKINEDHATEVFDFLTQLDYQCYSIDEDGLNVAHSLVGQNSRNFLFIPGKMPLDHYSFDNILTSLHHR